jgi:hypothetical protein
MSFEEMSKRSLVSNAASGVPTVQPPAHGGTGGVVSRRFVRTCGMASDGRLHMVRAIFQGFFGRGRPRRSAFTCYLRENGPIAYELDLFTTAPRERADAMMSSPLNWAWKSSAREWTHLTRISLSAFLGDVPSGALLVAAETDLPTHLTDAHVAEWMRRFSRVQPVPLSAVIDVRPDRQLLFVQQHASEAINHLLAEWGLDKRAAERKSYARLGAASLEQIAERL